VFRTIQQLLFMGVVAVSNGSAGILASFDAAVAAPGTQNWTAESGILSGALIDDSGTPAWRMTGNNCCGYWFDALTTQQWSDSFDFGWSLRGIARIDAASTSIGYIFLDTPATLANRFDMVFGFDGTNAWVGLSDWFDAANPTLKHNLTGNDYHLFDMRYDPASQTAGLWVDGVQVLSGYTGHTQFRESHGPAWGVAGFSLPANFNCIAFTVNDGGPVDGCGVDAGGAGAIPEPATFALAVAGLLSGALLRRCR
jgi:hypothetical protein